MFGLSRRKDETVLRAGATLPAGQLVYAIGDIHGRADLLTELHRRILADAAERPAQRRSVVYLGDYVDRGPDSRAVIAALLEASLDGFESTHLLGNHEEFLLRFLEDESAADAWLLNGGDATLASYGVDPWMQQSGMQQPDGGAALEMQRAFRRRLPARHLSFLRALSLCHRIGSYYFVHAGIRPGIALDEQRREDMLWIRDLFLDSKADHGAVVVHGHSIRRRPERRDNRIGVDTGAYASGTLTALVLEAAEGGVNERFIQT